jgi:hypothetical protein
MTDSPNVEKTVLERDVKKHKGRKKNQESTISSLKKSYRFMNVTFCLGLKNINLIKVVKRF